MGSSVVGAGTATGRKGSMWAAVPAAAARDAVADDDDDVPLGPGQLPPRNAHLPPLHAEINISIIMIKGQLELEVTTTFNHLKNFILLLNYIRTSHNCFRYCLFSIWHKGGDGAS